MTIIVFPNSGHVCFVPDKLVPKIKAAEADYEETASEASYNFIQVIKSAYSVNLNVHVVTGDLA